MSGFYDDADDNDYSDHEIEEDDEEDFHDDDDDDSHHRTQIDEAVIKSAWSKPMVTKFERAVIIGSRAEAIANGAEPFVDVGNMYDPLEMAEMEFNKGKLNFNIVRSIPTQNSTTYVEYIVKPENLLTHKLVMPENIPVTKTPSVN